MFFVVLAGGVLASLYPAFIVVRPDAATRVQVRLTRNTPNRYKRVVGQTFQRFLRVDPTAEPWNDRATLTRVRLFGIAELAIICVVVAALLALL
jgi:hypothetical protein